MSTSTEFSTAFVRMLRSQGIRVPLTRSVTYLQALECLGLDEPSGVYWAGRSALIARHEDIKTYNRCFAAFFGQGFEQSEPGVPAPYSVALVLDSEDDSPESSDEGDTLKEFDEVLTLRFSDTEVLRDKDFSSLTAAELSESLRLMSKFRFHPPQRRSQRHHPSHSGKRVDLRRTVRKAISRDGEAIERKLLEKGTRTRRIVFICDISGSMEPYSRALVRFVHAAMVGTRRVEVFTLGTRLTRITRELDTHDAAVALARAAGAVKDWSGGTRLGEGIREFNDRYGVRGMARGSTVVILSDGWDRGDPQLLSAQLERMRRVSHKVVWVNPLKASPGYAPLARGMAAAMPHLDEFVEGHSLGSLELLAEIIAK